MKKKLSNFNKEIYLTPAEEEIYFMGRDDLLKECQDIFAANPALNFTDTQIKWIRAYSEERFVAGQNFVLNRLMEIIKKTEGRLSKKSIIAVIESFKR